MDKKILVYPYNGILSTDIKKWAVKTWVNLKYILLSERSSSEKTTYCMITFPWHSAKVGTIATKEQHLWRQLVDVCWPVPSLTGGKDENQPSKASWNDPKGKQPMKKHQLKKIYEIPAKEVRVWHLTQAHSLFPHPSSTRQTLLQSAAARA